MRDIAALLKYNGADKSTRRRRSQIILNTGPVQHIFHLSFLLISFLIFHSHFESREKDFKCIRIYGICKIVGTVFNGTHHLGGNTSEKRMGVREEEDYGKRYLCGTLWPVSSSTCITDRKIPSTNRPLQKTEESCNATIPRYSCAHDVREAFAM